jgi:LCP family protein required for cell wall assembly
LPPDAWSVVTLYRVPEAPRRSWPKRIVRGLLFALLGLLVVVFGMAGGLYLWFHQSLAAIRAHSPAVVRAQKHLNVSMPGHAAIALLLGNNLRAGFERSAGGRSDTMMLLRADPATHSISMLSIPRDLRVPVYCPGSGVPRQTTRIDYAFAWCGPSGSLDTVQHLTGLPVNFLITVNFHGFKEIVNHLGGIWLDIDRRYYNKDTGTAATDYSNIDLQPGYQRLSGGSALQFVRFRHTDSDLHRIAREQEFIRSLRSLVEQKFDPLQLPGIVSVITQNVEVGACRGCLSDLTAFRYALFAISLPRGHILEDSISNVTDINVDGAAELQTTQATIAQAVYRFTHPNTTLTASANAVLLGEKQHRTRRTQPSASPAVTVLNGNGVPGAAALASALLRRRGYHVVALPAGRTANAPNFNYFHTAIYYRPGTAGAQQAAQTLANLFAPADIATLTPQIAARSGTRLVAVVGSTFHNTLPPPPPPPPRITRQPPFVTFAPQPMAHLVRPLQSYVPFPLESPQLIERTSYPDPELPIRLYTIEGSHKAVRLVYRLGNVNEYWGVEETDWTGAPILNGRNYQRTFAGRTFDLYYSGQHLHMIVLHTQRASYWLINTLLDSLNNETMLTIAKSLHPLHQ